MIIQRGGHKESTEQSKSTERAESTEEAESTERQSEYSTGEKLHV